jgi:hypothetical protein
MTGDQPAASRKPQALAECHDLCMVDGRLILSTTTMCSRVADAGRRRQGAARAGWSARA